MTNKVVLALYRTKLKICIANGYKLGSKEINNNIYKKKMFNKNGILGQNIFELIKFEYKRSRYVTNKDLIDQRIDNAFYVLRQ